MLAHTFKQQSFAARVGWDKTIGKKKLELTAPLWLQQFLNLHTKVGDNLTITIKNHKPKRTILQNNYYWGAFLPAIADETGEEDLDRLHELFKGKFLTETIAEVLGEKVRIKKSTTDLTVAEFIEFIQAIEKFTGVTAPRIGRANNIFCLLSTGGSKTRPKNYSND